MLIDILLGVFGFVIGLVVAGIGMMLYIAKGVNW